MVKSKLFLFFIVPFLFVAQNSTAQSVEVILPKDHFISQEDSVLFTWNRLSKTVEHYHIQIALDSLFANIQYDANTQSKHYLINNLTPENIYYWRIRAFDQGFYTNWSDTLSFRYYKPSLSDSLIIWYKPDYGLLTSDTLIQQWHNAVADTMHLSQGVEAKQPYVKDSVKLLNNHSCITFDGVNDFLQTDLLAQHIIQPLTIISFFNSQKTSYSHLYDAKTVGPASRCFGTIPDLTKHQIFGGTYLTLNAPYLPNTYCIRSDIYKGTTSVIDLYKGGQSTGNTGTNTMDGITVGARWSGVFPFMGELNEMLIYDKPLNDSLLNLNYEYLRWKYAPPVNLGENKYCELDSSVISIDNSYVNYLWSTGDTTASTTVYTNGRYYLSVTDIFGNVSVDSIYIDFHEQPNLINIEDSTLCYGDTIKWGTGVSGYNYNWSNLSTDSLLEIHDAGTYYYILSDQSFCTYASDTAIIHIDTYPINVDLGEDDTICAGQNIGLINGANETQTYLWSTAETEPSIVISEAGQYHVTTTNSLGCTAKDTINIRIKGFAPLAGFDYQNQCFGDVTHFIDTSQSTDLSNIVAWYWDFDYGNTSNLQNPELTFPDTGTYNISLRVETDSLCQNTISQAITIYANPIAKFENNELCENYLINFVNTSSSSMDELEHYQWIFSGNDTLTEASVQHTFTEHGEQTVNLSVRTMHGCENVLDTFVTIKPSPKANFSHTPSCVNRNITFYDESLTEGIFSIANRLWETSNGNSSQGNSPTFVFDETGQVNVKLIATSINGCRDSIIKNLWIFDNPTARFETDTLCKHNNIQINNTSVDAVSQIKQYFWWMNGELISTSMQPQYTLPDTGTHILKLKVVSESNCYHTYTDTISVKPLPFSGFTVSEDYTTPQQTVVFTADSLKDDNQYTFHLGNGRSESEPITSTIYDQEGVYTAQLIVHNRWQCADSIQKDITVVQPLMDLLLSNINLLEQDDLKYRLNINLVNIGNLNINGFVFNIEADDQMVFEEVSDTNLNIGEAANLTLATQLLKKPSYLCITARPKGIYTDIEPENNSICLNLSKATGLVKLFPNPVKDKLHILYNSRQDESVKLTVINRLGQTVRSLELSVKQGLNKYSIPAKGLASGAYILKIGELSQTFIKD